MSGQHTPEPWVSMNGINDGRPAFPQPIFQRTDGAVLTAADFGYSGMTLRDYFAAKAMAALYPVNFNLGVHSKTELAAEAYEIADAMLRAREAK